MFWFFVFLQTCLSILIELILAVPRFLLIEFQANADILHSHVGVTARAPYIPTLKNVLGMGYSHHSRRFCPPIWAQKSSIQTLASIAWVKRLLRGDSVPEYVQRVKTTSGFRFVLQWAPVGMASIGTTSIGFNVFGPVFRLIWKIGNGIGSVLRRGVAGPREEPETTRFQTLLYASSGDYHPNIDSPGLESWMDEFERPSTIVVWFHGVPSPALSHGGTNPSVRHVHVAELWNGSVDLLDSSLQPNRKLLAEGVASVVRFVKAIDPFYTPYCLDISKRACAETSASDSVAIDPHTSMDTSQSREPEDREELSKLVECSREMTSHESSCNVHSTYLSERNEPYGVSPSDDELQSSQLRHQSKRDTVMRSEHGTELEQVQEHRMSRSDVGRHDALRSNLNTSGLWDQEMTLYESPRVVVVGIAAAADAVQGAALLERHLNPHSKLQSPRDPMTNVNDFLHGEPSVMGSFALNGLDERIIGPFFPASQLILVSNGVGIGYAHANLAEPTRPMSLDKRTTRRSSPLLSLRRNADRRLHHRLWRTFLQLRDSSIRRTLADLSEDDEEDSEDLQLNTTDQNFQSHHQPQAPIRNRQTDTLSTEVRGQRGGVGIAYDPSYGHHPFVQLPVTNRHLSSPEEGYAHRRTFPSSALHQLELVLSPTVPLSEASTSYHLWDDRIWLGVQKVPDGELPSSPIAPAGPSNLIQNTLSPQEQAMHPTTFSRVSGMEVWDELGVTHIPRGGPRKRLMSRPSKASLKQSQLEEPTQSPPESIPKHTPTILIPHPTDWMYRSSQPAVESARPHSGDLPDHRGSAKPLNLRSSMILNRETPESQKRGVQRWFRETPARLLHTFSAGGGTISTNHPVLSEQHQISPGQVPCSFETVTSALSYNSENHNLAITRGWVLNQHPPPIEDPTLSNESPYNLESARRSYPESLLPKTSSGNNTPDSATIGGTLKSRENLAASLDIQTELKRVLDALTVPTLILHSRDDPVVPFQTIPLNFLHHHPNVILVVTRRGGHGGFLDRSDLSLLCGIKSFTSALFWGLIAPIGIGTTESLWNVPHASPSIREPWLQTLVTCFATVEVNKRSGL